MASNYDENQPSFKCRKCRHFLFSGASVLPSSSLDNDAVLASNHDSTALSPVSSRCQQPYVDSALWYIDDDARPPWIQSAIEEAQWTRGKLACPKCRGRLGSFDFLTPSIRHCQDRQRAWSCVQIISSRVDREVSHSVLANLRQGNQSQGLDVKGHSLKGDSCTSGASPLADNSDGTLPKGCWYFNSDREDTDQFLMERVNVDVDDIFGKFWDAQARNHLKEDDKKSSSVITRSSVDTRLRKSTHITTSKVNRSHSCTGDGLMGTDSIPVDQSLSFRALMHRDISSSVKDPPNDGQVRPAGGRGKPVHSDTEFCASFTDAVDESIQFGIHTPLYDEDMGVDKDPGLSDNSASNVLEEGASECNHVITAQLEAKAFGSPASPDLRQQAHDPSHSRSVDDQNSHNEEELSQRIQNARRGPIHIEHSPDEIEDEIHSMQARVVINSASSPLRWQDFLDELLVELEEERNGTLSMTSSSHNDINRLEDDMETDSFQEASVNTDEATVSQEESQDDSQGMSAYLQRAILRAQRRERNRRRSERRKARRQEKWKEEKETKKKELLEEEQILDSNSQKILPLLSTGQTSESVREALTCPVCLDLYFNPHVCLPCQHIFCEPCLRYLAFNTQTPEVIPCPLCRSMIDSVQSHDKLTAAIAELLPRMMAQRQHADRKTLRRSYPLPGRRGAPAHHQGVLGRARLGLIRNVPWKLGAVFVLLIILFRLSGAIFVAALAYL